MLNAKHIPTLYEENKIRCNFYTVAWKLALTTEQIKKRIIFIAYIWLKKQHC